MAGKWIILGYPDGTFKPDDNIIKTHAFLMFARINGYFDTENEVIIKEAIKENEDILKENNITQGVAEIAFLIHTNVISTEDVIDLLGNGKENELLTREEAAYIYVKLLSDEENLNRFPLVTFDDANNIDEKYLSYVEYVNKIGLMIGLEDNTFNVIYKSKTTLSMPLKDGYNDYVMVMSEMVSQMCKQIVQKLI